MSMLIVLDQTNPLPLYEQIARQVKLRILTGELPAGAALPSIRQLAAQLVTSVITTKRAYEELESEGLIVTRPGVGSVVATLTDEELERLRLGDLEQRLRHLVAEARGRGVDAQTIAALLRKVTPTDDDAAETKEQPLT